MPLTCEWFLVCVSGTQMTITPSTVMLNTVPSREVTMACGLTAGEHNLEVAILVTMRIIRLSARESNSNNEKWTVLAEVSEEGDPQLGTAQDITNRKPGLTGQLLKIGPKNIGELTLTWNSSQIKCQDEEMYGCEFRYIDINFQDAIFTGYYNLSTAKYPEKLEMEYRNGNVTQVVPDNAITRYEGEVVEMSCTAHIGSHKSRTIDWFKTRSFQDDPDDLQKFTPTINDVLDPDTPTDTMLDCSYSLTSTLRYNISDLDMLQNEPFKFACRVYFTTTAGLYEYQESKRLIISVASSDVTTIGTETIPSNATSDATTVGTETIPINAPSDATTVGTETIPIYGGTNVRVITDAVTGALAFIIITASILY